MRIIDVDAHVHEPVDWLERTDPGLAGELGPHLLLGALVFDGVLERHPKLTVVVEEVGISWLPHLLCFSSDYPHVEGTAPAVAICERQLAGCAPAARESFYGGVAARIGL